MKDKNKLKKAGITVSIFTLIAIGFTVGILLNMNISQPVVEQVVHERSWRPIPLGDPAGDASGFCEFYHYPHQASPSTAYATNLSTGNAYEYITSLSGEMTGETPHSTTYDYVVKIVVNDTVAYNSTSSLWMPSWINMSIMVDYDFGSDIAWTQTTLVEITNTTDHCWYNCYLNNGGAGYTLSQNQKTNTSFNCTVWW